MPGTAQIAQKHRHHLGLAQVPDAHLALGALPLVLSIAFDRVDEHLAHLAGVRGWASVVGFSTAAPPGGPRTVPGSPSGARRGCASSLG